MTLPHGTLFRPFQRKMLTRAIMSGEERGAGRRACFRVWAELVLLVAMKTCHRKRVLHKKINRL